jgi:histidinol-phosphate/aromatic aminotransferase/cobyric acid decarboxylase-like protein
LVARNVSTNPARPDSGGNFLLVQLRGKAPAVASRATARTISNQQDRGKDVSEKYSDWLPRIRIAVRTQKDNDRLLYALQSLAMADMS